jgi:hypothetical protein
MNTLLILFWCSSCWLLAHGCIFSTPWQAASRVNGAGTALIEQEVGERAQGLRGLARIDQGRLHPGPGTSSQPRLMRALRQASTSASAAARGAVDGWNATRDVSDAAAGDRQPAKSVLRPDVAMERMRRASMPSGERRRGARNSSR